MEATVSRQAYVDECRKYLGVRWQHQGRSENGLDCAGLLIVPALNLGILQAEDNVADYGRAPHDDTLTRLLHQHCRRLRDWRDAGTGDVLAIKYAAPHPHHLMVVTQPYNPKWGLHVIHAYGSTEAGGGVVEHRVDGRWLKSVRASIHAAYHINGVMNEAE